MSKIDKMQEFLQLDDRLFSYEIGVSIQMLKKWRDGVHAPSDRVLRTVQALVRQKRVSEKYADILERFESEPFENYMERLIDELRGN